MSVQGDVVAGGLPRLAIPKAADVLATHLRTQILSGRLPEGTVLPTQGQLAAAVGLSRGTVRDALRVLEGEGLVVVGGPGRAGTRVRRPDAETLTRSFMLLVDGHGVPVRSLLETRDILEPAGARLAAMSRSDADVAALEELSARMRDAAEDMAEFARCNIAWHAAVARANGNQIMAVLLDALCRAVTSEATLPERQVRRAVADTLAAHDRVVAAIRERDADRAAWAMGRHVHGYRVLVEASVAATGP